MENFLLLLWNLSMKKIISLDEIDIAHSPGVRAEFRPEVADEYAEQYLDKKNKMPLPVLFKDPTMKVPYVYLIGDGLHRIRAMQKVGLKLHMFEIMEGSRADCIKFALQSNIGHGIRRTNADKRHCVTLALQEFRGVSNGVIADYCAVGADLVADVLKELLATGAIPKPEKTVGLDGKARTVNPRLTTVETSETQQIHEKPEGASPVPTQPVVPSAGEEVKDETGITIPPKALAVWNRRHEVEPFLDTVEELKADVEALKDAGDPLFAETNFNSLIADLANVRAQLLLARPYAVCFACSGKLPETCKVCLGKGMTSKFRHSLAPAEILKMRGGT